MKNGFKAMDSDMHVMEPCDLWQKYIDRKFLDRAPKGLNRHKRDLARWTRKDWILPFSTRAGGCSCLPWTTWIPNWQQP